MGKKRKNNRSEKRLKSVGLSYGKSSEKKKVKGKLCKGDEAIETFKIHPSMRDRDVVCSVGLVFHRKRRRNIEERGGGANGGGGTNGRRKEYKVLDIEQLLTIDQKEE